MEENKEIDIRTLIQNSSIEIYEKNNLIDKLKNHFSHDEQKLYVSNLFLYLNHHQLHDFIVNLDNVWKFIGFSNKANAKRLLKHNFTENKDYKISLVRIDDKKNNQTLLIRTDEQVSSKNLGGAGLNKETIMLNINTFKKLCLKANTENADKIHDYYIKLEMVYNELMKEELQKKEKLLIEQREQTEQEKEQLLETTLLNQYHKNVQCIYYGKIDNKDTVGGSLVKFGMSNNLQERVKNHKKTYTNFRLTNVFKVSNQIEIENCIKNHPILKKRIRSIMLNDLNYRELIYIDSTKNEPDFSLETLDEYIKQIIEENQYNLENYKRLLEKNETLESEIYTLRQTSKTLQEENTKLKNKIDKFKPNPEEKRLMTHNKIDTINGYSLFAFECDKQNFRYKINLCKTLTLELREKTYKITFPDCELKYQTKIKHAFIEKILLYLLKRHLTFLNNETYDGSLENIKLIFNIVSKIEDLLINNDLENIFKILNNEKIETILNDPEIPFIKKSKRSIDQVDPTTGTVINTYPSIEAAGRSCGITGSAIGIALRNKTLSIGYKWCYSGISKDDQMKDQPVIRIKCCNGEKTHYPNIASAAKSAKISPPGLRNRILTDVHSGGFHWVFDKTSTHYI